MGLPEESDPNRRGGGGGRARKRTHDYDDSGDKVQAQAWPRYPNGKREADSAPQQGSVASLQPARLPEPPEPSSPALNVTKVSST